MGVAAGAAVGGRGWVYLAVGEDEVGGAEAVVGFGEELRRGVGALVTHKLLQRADGIAAETPACGIGPLEKIARQEVCEKRLGRVFRIRRRVAAAAQVAVNGWPVRLAEMFERLLPPRLIAARIAHEAPSRGRKITGGWRWWRQWRTGLKHVDEAVRGKKSRNAKDHGH